MEFVDDSFKKPGAIPFKWEIRPGVPKLQQYYDEEEFSSFPETPRKLTPPPSAAGYCSQTGSSFRSTPPPRSGSSRSRSFRFYSNNHPQPQQQQQRRNVGVSSTTTSGCFPSPLLIKRRSEKNKTKKKHKTTSKEETASNSDVETLSPRLSVSNSSSWKSLSPLPDSPLSSSFSSYSNYQYSTPPTLTPGRRLGKVSSKDAADWAGFGLF